MVSRHNIPIYICNSNRHLLVISYLRICVFAYSRDGLGYDAICFSVLVWSFVVLLNFLSLGLHVSSASQLIMVP